MVAIDGTDLDRLQKAEEGAGLPGQSYHPSPEEDSTLGGKHNPAQNANLVTQLKRAEKPPTTNDVPPRGTKKGKDGVIARLRGVRRGPIIGVLIGGGGIGAVVSVIISLTPLKPIATITALDLQFGGPSKIATTQAADNLLNTFIAHDLLPGLHAGRCKTSIEPTCVGDIEGKGPVKQLYQAWKEHRIEKRLAEKGVVFGRRGPNLYMAVGGNEVAGNSELLDVIAGKSSIFEIGTSHSLNDAKTLAAARKAIRDAFKDATLWEKTIIRFRTAKLLEAKYGIRRCVVACKIRDTFKAPIEAKKLAAKTKIISLVIRATQNQNGVVLLCIIQDSEACRTSLEKIKANAQEGKPLIGQESGFTTQVETTFGEFADATSVEALDIAVKKAEELVGDNKSFTEFAIGEMVSKVFGEQAGKVATKAVPVVGWVLLAATIIHGADKIGPKLRIMSYAISAVAAVHLYMTYRTLVSEAKSGHMDAAEYGSFVQALSTNLSGSPDDRVDASETPLYGALNGHSAQKSNYKCNDGSSVPSGALVCPEEKLDRGNDIANTITNAVDFVPGLAGLAAVVDKVNELIGWLIGGAFQAACYATDRVPPGNSCTNSVQLAGKYVGQLAEWLVNVVVPSPFAGNMSGGRIFDMLAAGADVASNKTCQQSLGCAKLSNQQVADLRNAAVATEKADFEQQPLLARIFSTASPDSLVSQLAVITPSSLPQAASMFIAAAGNPFSTLANSFGNLVSGPKAFAAISPIDDPFGVVQYGYTPDQIPNDPEAYWNDHCQGDSVITWLNNQEQDMNTGEPVANTPQPCLLIESMTQATGVMFDSTLVPADAQNQ